MARQKQLNIKIKFGETGYVVSDLGEGKTPRFELFHIPTNKIIEKSNNPLNFDKYINKMFGNEEINSVLDKESKTNLSTSRTKTKRTRRTKQDT